jgi:hypothetical protein
MSSGTPETNRESWDAAAVVQAMKRVRSKEIGYTMRDSRWAEELSKYIWEERSAY